MATTFGTVVILFATAVSFTHTAEPRERLRLDSVEYVTGGDFIVEVRTAGAPNLESSPSARFLS